MNYYLLLSSFNDFLGWGILSNTWHTMYNPPYNCCYVWYLIADGFNTNLGHVFCQIICCHIYLHCRNRPLMTAVAYFWHGTFVIHFEDILPTSLLTSICCCCLWFTVSALLMWFHGWVGFTCHQQVPYSNNLITAEIQGNNQK
jgi:hypothetical protein